MELKIKAYGIARIHIKTKPDRKMGRDNKNSIIIRRYLNGSGAA
jgi:hypothetical protein